ncbi:DUF6506 family protein [bacterium 210820-DFI.6.37]|nr:DUF6506 family protein [bacterium 210820-DFI.6.37]
MFKYAFIENVDGAAPETYSFVYENEESTSLVAGTSSFEMTEELVKKLDSEGYDLIDMCGDFDDAAVEKLLKVTKNGIRICHADYLPVQLEKIEALESLKEYGIVIVMDGVEETQSFTLESEACNTHARFTKDLEAAKAAAKELVDQGVSFLELCSYFDRTKTLEIIDAIDGAVPVGSCGKLK